MNKNEIVLARVNARLDAYAKNNSFFWETMTEGSKVALMREILMEELERYKYENINFKDWLIECVHAGGHLIQDCTNEVRHLAFNNGHLSHIRYDGGLIEIDWDNSFANYKEAAVVLFGWDEEGCYTVSRYEVVVPFVV